VDRDAERQVAEVGGTVSGWRQFHSARLEGARHVVAPSNSAREHFRRSLPIEKIEVLPHPELAFSFRQRRWNGTLPYRIAVLGAIGPHKGSSLLLACARYALRENLPLHFVIIGYTSCDEEFAELENVEITGHYKPDELRPIVEDSDCTTALFLSVWPETFSYTLSEAWRLGLYPVALDIGAPAERIREMRVGKVIPFTTDPRKIVIALVDVLNEERMIRIS